MNSINKILAVTLLSVLVGCGGGGGGDGGAGGDGGRNTSSAATGVRVLHGAIDAPPVDLYRATGSSVDTVNFGTVSYYASFGEGDNTAIITKAKTPTAQIAALPVSLQKREHKSLLLYGDKATFGLRTKIIDDSPGDLTLGTSALKVVHALIGAGTLRVAIDGVPMGESVGFGDASSYQTVSPGVHTLTITRGSDGAPLASRAVDIAAGKAFTVLTTGEVGVLVLTPLFED